MSAAQYSQRATDFRWLASQTTDDRAQRVLIELAMEYEALAAGSSRRVKHFSPSSLSGCDDLKHGVPSARGHVVKGHVARPAGGTPPREPAAAPSQPQTTEVNGAGQ
jgi:hypothetical protein